MPQSIDHIRTSTTRPRLLTRIILAFGLVLGVLVGSVSLPAYGANTTLTLSAKQSGQHIDLSWSTRGSLPTKVSLVLRNGNKSVAALSARGSAKKARFTSVSPGEYQVLLTSQKPKLSTSARLTVYGPPAAVSELTVLRLGSEIHVDWQTGGGSRFTKADSVTVVLRSAGKEFVSEVPAGTTNLRLLSPDLTSKVEVLVTAKNRYGVATSSTGVIEADTSARIVTEPRLVTQAAAEEVFGSFAMINRSPLGPVDLSNPSVGSENLVMKTLQDCVSTKDGVTIRTQGMVNIGAVLATRNSTGTIILTSGATALTDPVAVEWINAHDKLTECVTPALVVQLRAVATQLSAAAAVDEVNYAPVDASVLGDGTRAMLVEGVVYLNGGVSAEAGQPMQVLWVTKGNGETISQYILIRVGSAIDQGMYERFYKLVAQLNR